MLVFFFLKCCRAKLHPGLIEVPEHSSSVLWLDYIPAQNTENLLESAMNLKLGRRVTFQQENDPKHEAQPH